MKSLSITLRSAAWLGVAAMVVSACGGNNKSTPPAVAVSPSPAPTSSDIISPNAATAYNCPTSDTTFAAARRPASLGTKPESVAHFAVRHSPRTVTATGSTVLLAVSYKLPAAMAIHASLAAREAALGAIFQRELAFTRTGVLLRIVSVPRTQVQKVENSLRAQANVRSVGITGQPRFAQSVNAPYFPNDPYFNGFTAQNGLPATFQVEPLVQTASVPGQWDMHVSQLEYAFAYSQASNGSGVVNANALGSTSVKLAVIDTGEDINHEELASKIVYQRCHLTNQSGVVSTSNFTTDPNGHGTDVAGIAAEASDNSFGFTGAGGNSEIYAYRVFPTPDDNCSNSDSSDPQCAADSTDIAWAIDDAVAQKVNVINLSLGGGGCSNGADPDPSEGAAIAEAIAANIVVVAAAGNQTGPPVEAPGCDAGVIATGATSIADGNPNGSGEAGGSSTAPFEYVSSFTDYGETGAAVNSASAWGIVAPGGDPTPPPNPNPNNVFDNDDLHWVENIWTTTPYMANSSDENFAGDCSTDFSGAANDCRVLIAGTSQASPHVAGAAALLIAANPMYQSPALMKQLLCTTADDISDPHEGCGRLNVYRAMAVAVGDANPPPSQPVP